MSKERRERTAGCICGRRSKFLRWVVGADVFRDIVCFLYCTRRYLEEVSNCSITAGVAHVCLFYTKKEINVNSLSCEVHTL